MARCLTRWFLPENVSKLRSCRTRDRKNRSGDMNRELLPAGLRIYLLTYLVSK